MIFLKNNTSFDWSNEVFHKNGPFWGGNQGPPCKQEEGGILGEIERKRRRAEELVLPTWLGAEERRLQGFIPNRNPGHKRKKASVGTFLVWVLR